MSVSQFTKDTQVFFEFQPNCCFGLLSLKRFCLSGAESVGLYKIYFSKMSDRSDVRFVSCNNFVAQNSLIPKSCFSGQFNFWSSVLHQRLGHPSAQALDFIKINNNMSVLFDNSHCSDWAIGKSCKLPFQSSKSVYTSPL